MASSEGIVDPTPFLANLGGRSSETNSSSRFVQRQSLLQAASSRRTMRESSMRVRETAAEQLEERQSDWAYSKPIVILDIVWNLAFVVVAGIILVLSRKESPNVPVRLWLVGYGFQCVLHIACACSEYRRRRQRLRAHMVNSAGDGNRTESGSDSRQNLSIGQSSEKEPRSLMFSHNDSPGSGRQSSEGIMTEWDTNSPVQHVLSQQDAECCICLCGYEDGVELRELSCGHHFHCACVDKRFHINATSPPCKYNILKLGSYGGDEV